MGVRIVKTEDKTGVEIFFEYAPSLKRWQNAVLTYLYQILIFVVLIVFFWWISSLFLYGAIIGQLVITFSLTIPYVYVIKNVDKIREAYRTKYDILAYQYFYYRFIIYIPPFGNASAILPFLLKTDYFLPSIISLPSHFITQDIFPYYSSIPISILFIILGVLIRKPSGGYDVDIQLLVYLIFPEKSRKITGGIYDYIRHPQYMGEGFIIIGVGIFANNLLALIVSLIHFLAYIPIIRIEDSELIKRFGMDFKKYQNRVPALFPKFGTWKNFFKYLIKSKD